MPRGIPKTKAQSAPTPETPVVVLREAIDRLSAAVDGLDVTASTVSGNPSAIDPPNPWDQSSLATVLSSAIERIDALRVRVENASSTIRVIVTP